MYDLERALDQQILGLRKARPTVVFTEAHDPRVIEAVCYLTRFVRPVLLSPESKVRELIRKELPLLDQDRVEYSMSECAFVDISERQDLVDSLAPVCHEWRKRDGHDESLEESRSCVAEPARFGIYAVQTGHADIVVGGATHAPREYFRPMLRVLGESDVQFEAGVFILPDAHSTDLFPHNIVVFGDVGVNESMTSETLAQVTVGTCEVARDLFPEDLLPEIHGAIVSYSHRGSDEGSSADLVRQAAKRVPGLLAEAIARSPQYRSIRIVGEVKVSVALSKRAAAYYRAGDDDWPGVTSVIICPNLDVSNLLYHLYATRYPTARKFTVLVGIGNRAVDIAMDCTPEDIRLAVKSCVVRLLRHGQWDHTLQDTFFRRYRVLTVNPGSTSTKIGVYEGENEVFTKEIMHSLEELAPFEGKKIIAQYPFRKEKILKALEEHGLSPADLDATSGRGGLLFPIKHGTYLVNERMRHDLIEGPQGDHASNLGGLIAHELVEGSGKPAFIVDPVVVDEAPDHIRITGIKTIRRKVISHALNQIATARRYAQENETFYERLNLIVCHMGGGITVGAHRKGHYIDVNNGLDGEGPFTPQRSGTLPPGQLIDLCFSGRYTVAEIKKLNKGRGGLIDLLGTSDMREVERRIDAGDAEAKTVFEAMAYQIAKHITALLPAFSGEPVDRILLTGGLARSIRLVTRIREFVAAVGCGVSVYPGENELAALALGALRVLSGKEKAREYAPGEP